MNSETAALICRVSTREQEEGYSLDAQETLLREFGARQGFDVQLVHRFSETASKINRRQKFRAFMEEVARRKIRHIVVEKVDRLTRSGLKEAVMIDDWLEADGARHLHCVKDGIDLHKFSRSGDKLNWGMRVVLAKNYTDNLREEIRKATETMLRKGIWPSKTPVGYVRDKSHPVCPIQPDPVRAPLIRTMFELYDTGEWSVHRLATHLFALGLRTKKDRIIYASQIHTMLQDSFYMGKMRFEGKLWDGIHVPLISEALFDRVQRRLRRAEGGVGAVVYQTHDHLFRGLAHCASCGKPLTWEVHKGRNYGYCKQYRRCSKRASIREDALEAVLIPRLDAFRLTSPRFARLVRAMLHNAHDDEQVRQEETKEEIERLLARTDQRLRRLLDMRIDDAISESDFETKRAELTREKQLLLERMGRAAECQNDFMGNMATLISLTQAAATRFREGPPERRRTMLRSVVSRMTVSQDRVTVEYTDLFRYLSEAVREWNSSKWANHPALETADFEPEEIGSGRSKEDDSSLNHPLWWEITDDFRTLFGSNLVLQRLESFAASLDSAEWERLLDALSDTSQSTDLQRPA